MRQQSYFLSCNYDNFQYQKTSLLHSNPCTPFPPLPLSSSFMIVPPKLLYQPPYGVGRPCLCFFFFLFFSFLWLFSFFSFFTCRWLLYRLGQIFLWEGQKTFNIICPNFSFQLSLSLPLFIWESVTCICDVTGHEKC